ncbi:MAG: DUF5320 domain-containing protein [Halanaerobiaceae bacterium]|nr:DUF5320 domain-containing protein [Halanaerobiaceae bacterium]
MPIGDGTGPAGYGPMTGRGMGCCAGYRVPGYMNRPGSGRGSGRGCDSGRGYGWAYHHAPHAYPVYPYHPPHNQEISKERKVEYLKETARALEDELKYVKEELKKLEEDKD